MVEATAAAAVLLTGMALLLAMATAGAVGAVAVVGGPATVEAAAAIEAGHRRLVLGTTSTTTSPSKPAPMATKAARWHMPEEPRREGALTLSQSNLYCSDR